MMPEDIKSTDELPLFPILRGESVGADGEVSGHVVIACTPEELDRDWKSDHIVVLDKELKGYITENPNAMNTLFSIVSAVISEFGEPLGQLSSSAYESDAICIAKVADASHVLENDMHIRVTAKENEGDVFFID